MTLGQKSSIWILYTYLCITLKLGTVPLLLWQFLENALHITNKTKIFFSYFHPPKMVNKILFEVTFTSSEKVKLFITYTIHVWKSLKTRNQIKALHTFSPFAGQETSIPVIKTFGLVRSYWDTDCHMPHISFNFTLISVNESWCMCIWTYLTQAVRCPNAH